MRNKILIVDANKEEKEQLELILQEVVNDGGELFFAGKTEDGLAILKKEHPQLVFLDAPLVGEHEDAWVMEGVHIILMRHKHDQYQQSEDFVLKPFKAHQVLEKCRMGLSKQPVTGIPPM